MIALHPDDQENIEALRRDLIGWRNFLGRTQKDIGQETGLGKDRISDMERGIHTAMKLPFLCRYAETFRHVIEFGTDLEVTYTPEIGSLEAMVMAKPYSGTWLDQLLTARLKASRLSLEIPADLMAKKLDMTSVNFEWWEEECAPHLFELMTYTRELGGTPSVKLARVS